MGWNESNRVGKVWKVSFQWQWSCMSWKCLPFVWLSPAHQKPLQPLKSMNASVICIIQLLFCLECRWLFNFNHILINSEFLHHSYFATLLSLQLISKERHASPTCGCWASCWGFGTQSASVGCVFNPKLTSNHQVLISWSDRPAYAVTNVGFGKTVGITF